MALLYRSIVEVESSTFVDEAHERFLGWLGSKRIDARQVTTDGESMTLDDTDEVRAYEASEEGRKGYRAHLFERRDGENVRTTFTALEDERTRWSWIDVDRWADDAYERGWVPYAPRLVNDILATYACRCSDTPMQRDYSAVNVAGAPELVRELLRANRTAPIVVVSPTADEREGDLGPARARAEEMARRVAGVAAVVLLESGATGAMSKAVLDEIGAGYDVHSGAVRTYLPSLGEPGDRPQRHRFVPAHRLIGRPAKVASELVAGGLLRAATHLQPPQAWRDGMRSALEGAGVLPDQDYPALLELAERERDDFADQLEVLHEQNDDDLESLDQALREVDRLRKNERKLEAQIRESGQAPAEPEITDDFDPAFCEEVLATARDRLPLLALPHQIDDGAEELDKHMNQAWARKAWRAMCAMQAYAEAKKAGSANGMNLLTYCQTGEGPTMPDSWLAMRESQTTDNNERFRTLRTLPVDRGVDRSERIYMPAHVKIQKGGSPCPRIHFHDDTDGATGKIHIGWFGDHLDNKSKS